ncbi:hypothetical protein EDB19DRAFT_1635128, partial [Suillus lakei]
AISTAVEHVFSQGHHLLSFTHNCLQGSSIQAFLCLGSWAHHDLILFEDLVAAMKANSKGNKSHQMLSRLNKHISNIQLSFVACIAN